ncbi:MAG: TRAP transporter large permease [Thermoanaerobacteraceae bacterium]|nr:TRAP transporter large permease [Thermoanaerobacteraceae bacterium]
MGITFFILFVLCVLSVPIVFSIGLAVFGGILAAGNIPLEVIPQRMFTQIDSFAMLAIPFFILAGNLMDKGGISQKIVNFASQLVGFIRGGLAMVMVVACMIFGSVSGSGAAASAAMGSILIPAMSEKGYDKKFSAALTATSGPLGIIIPPSIVMVVYSTVANVSVGKMFLAGYIPGIIIGLSLMIVSYIHAIRNNYPAGQKPSLKSFLKSLGEAIWAILMVVIIMGGILSGYFTATEASVVAVFYALIVGMFVYKGLKLNDLPNIILKSSYTTAAIMFCCATTNALAWLLTSEQVIAKISNSILGIAGSKVAFLLIANFIFLFLGMILDSTPAILLAIPILLPAAKQLGIDPVHFGIITTVNLAIGMSTPPVGITLFTASSIAKTSVSDLVKPLIPMWIAMIAFLMIITYIPQISLFLPSIF